jgi:xeroderma pigmentosum group C-complementing protein
MCTRRYVLEQHLKRDEIIFPKDEIGKFRGEPVYPRSNVIALKTAENWMRSGRKVKEGCQPLKMVKQRAVTVHRRRAIEMAQQDGEEVTQGLYSEMQTELFVPDPVVNVSVALWGD